MDHRQIVEEAEAYAEAGVHHVVAAPWRRTAEEWIDSMATLVELVPLD
jgi:biotin synthase-like enzyme